MADRIGVLHPRAVLATSEYLEPGDIDHVRAYPVPVMENALLVSNAESALDAALEALLTERIGDFGWRVDQRLNGPLRKYGLLHTSIVAPPLAGSEPMWLELVGRVEMVEGRDVRARPWNRVWPTAYGPRSDTPLRGPIAIRIETSTYSNRSHTGIDVPFYI